MNRILERKVDASTSDRELGIIVQALISFKEHSAAGENRETAAKYRACRNPDRMMAFCTFVKRLTLTVGGECLQVAYMVVVELSRLRLILIAAPSECKDRVNNLIFVMQDSFPVEASCAG